MRRRLWLVFAFAAGLAVGAITSRPSRPVDHSGEITVRRGMDAVEFLRPHRVRIDGKTVFERPAPDGPVTLVTLDGGRVAIAATSP